MSAALSGCRNTRTVPCNALLTWLEAIVLPATSHATSQSSSVLTTLPLNLQVLADSTADPVRTLLLPNGHLVLQAAS
jgi:hypothetical protein